MPVRPVGAAVRAPLVWLAVLRHCFGFPPEVGMQLLRSRGWKLDQALAACEQELPERIATGCKLAEAYQWVAGLKVLLAVGGFHPFKALSHGEEAPLIVYKALSEQLREFLEPDLVNRDHEHLR